MWNICQISGPFTGSPNLRGSRQTLIRSRHIDPIFESCPLPGGPGRLSKWNKNGANRGGYLIHGL